MMRWLTRKRAIWLGAGLLVMALFAVAFVPAPAHEVHSPGGSALSVKVYAPDPNSGFFSNNVPASQSLAQIRCSLWTSRHSGQTCDPAAIQSTIFPTVAQSPNTLYVAWTGCIAWHGAGAVIPWEGFNVEYIGSSRTVIIHCYIGTPWLYFPEREFGLVALIAPTLLALPTSSIGSGQLTIDEDDRLEHLVGDQSTEFRLTTAVVG